MAASQQLYHELLCYSLALRDKAFIHQYIVDAYAAEYANETTKPISIVFSLLGLYLYLEKGFTGRQVQRVHMQLAERRRRWLAPPLPQRQIATGVADVMAAPMGRPREAAIRAWCEAVWESWRPARPYIVALAREHLGIPE